MNKKFITLSTHIQKKLNTEHTQKLYDLINKEPARKELLEWARNHGIRIRSDHKCTMPLHYASEERIIYLNSHTSPKTLVNALTDELIRYQKNYKNPPIRNDKRNIDGGISQTSYFWKMNADIITKKRSHDQKKDDEKRIQQIRDLTKKSPLGREILKWADKHDVSIYLDHQCEKAIGYYGSGSNSVCLNSNYKNNALISTLAHELRHCWQDHNGLISGKKTSPQEYAARTRFIEADAFAFGYCVGYEVSTKTGISGIGSRLFNERAKQALEKDPNALKNGVILSDFFELFFTLNMPRHLYDTYSLKAIANHLKIIDFKIPNVTGEFTHIGILAKHAQYLNPYDEKNVRKLGDIFGQYNYLDHRKESLSRDRKYLGNFAKEHKTLFKQIKHHKKMQKKSPCKRTQNKTTDVLKTPWQEAVSGTARTHTPEQENNHTERLQNHSKYIKP